LFAKATNFNNALQNIYFNHLVTNSNPNIAEMDAATFDVNVVINKLNARKCWQISNLSSVYAEMCVIGSNISEAIIAGGSINLSPTEFEYSTLVGAINVLVNEAEAIQVAGSEANKLTFYQLSKQAYNAQTMLNNDNSKFLTACNLVDYASDKEGLSASEIMSKQIIEDYCVVLKEYNQVLKNMLDLIEV